MLVFLSLLFYLHLTWDVPTFKPTYSFPSTWPLYKEVMAKLLVTKVNIKPPLFNLLLCNWSTWECFWNIENVLSWFQIMIIMLKVFLSLPCTFVSNSNLFSNGLKKIRERKGIIINQPKLSFLFPGDSPAGLVSFCEREGVLCSCLSLSVSSSTPWSFSRPSFTVTWSLHFPPPQDQASKT